MIENKRGSFEIDDENLMLLSSKLDSDQLSAVKETGNVVVSAGAGSGKTTVLASRYAYLVEAKNVPCPIKAIQIINQPFCILSDT